MMHDETITADSLLADYADSFDLPEDALVYVWVRCRECARMGRENCCWHFSNDNYREYPHWHFAFDSKPMTVRQAAKRTGGFLKKIGPRRYIDHRDSLSNPPGLVFEWAFTTESTPPK